MTDSNDKPKPKIEISDEAVDLMYDLFLARTVQTDPKLREEVMSNPITKARYERVASFYDGKFGGKRIGEGEPVPVPGDGPLYALPSCPHPEEDEG